MVGVVAASDTEPGDDMLMSSSVSSALGCPETGALVFAGGCTWSFFPGLFFRLGAIVGDNWYCQWSGGILAVEGVRWVLFDAHNRVLVGW